MHKSTLLQRLSDKSATIGIVGLGYVGLPLLLRFVTMGYRVVGIDIDENKVAKLNDSQSYIDHISSDALNAAKHNYDATTDFSVATEVDAIILCVPTPLDKYREPDLSFVLDTVAQLKPYLCAGQVLALESTTYPGTTDEELAPRVASAGLTLGEDFFLAYSPEREDPGNTEFETATIPKVCSGVTANCREVAEALYKCVVDKVVPVSSVRVAEMTKLLENIHRSVNIGLANEMKILADKMDIDIYEVINAAATKPFGFVPYYPGPGIGGHCIPIDPFYLTWKAREFGLHTRFIELAGEINDAMPQWVLEKVATALNTQKKAVNGCNVMVLGVAYKKNVDDFRESPSLDVIKLLKAQGAEISYSDPHVHKIHKMRKFDMPLASIDLTPEVLAATDCVILTTAHDAFDYDMIVEHANLIVDTRGAFRKYQSEKIIRA